MGEFMQMCLGDSQGPMLKYTKYALDVDFPVEEEDEDGQDGDGEEAGVKPAKSKKDSVRHAIVNMMVRSRVDGVTEGKTLTVRCLNEHDAKGKDSVDMRSKLD